MTKDKKVNVKKISIYCWSNSRSWRFLKRRKQDDESNISPVLIVHLQKCQRLLESVRGNDQCFLILFGLKSRS